MIDEVARARLRKYAAALSSKADEIYAELPREVKERHLHDLLKKFIDRALEALVEEGVAKGDEEDRRKAIEAVIEVIQGEFDFTIDPQRL